MKIKNLKLVASTGQEGNSFVGIKVINDNIEFHYPETFNLSNNEKGLKKDVFMILNTLFLANQNTEEQSENKKDGKLIQTFPLYSYFWIINDYLENGIFHDNTIKYNNGINGKIDWKRTINKSLALPTENGIFFDKILSYRKSELASMITEIYIYCLKKAVDLVGWIFSDNLNFDDKNSSEKFNRNKYIYALNENINNTFDDKKIVRLKHMLRIVNSFSDDRKEKNDLVFGVDSYDFIFEKMIDLLLSSNINNINKFYPSAAWNLYIDENINYLSSRLRPDTVIERNNNLFIIDAKNYRFGFTFKVKDLPKTDSIQKQITYAEFAENYLQEYKSIYSAFLMPYNKENNLHLKKFNSDFACVGTAEAQWDPLYQKRNSKKVLGILIDTKYLVNNYNTQSIEPADKLINLINIYNNKLNDDK